eukprot:5401133-Pyramimonas_sp.AAC.1
MELETLVYTLAHLIKVGSDVEAGRVEGTVPLSACVAVPLAGPRECHLSALEIRKASPPPHVSGMCVNLWYTCPDRSCCRTEWAATLK